MGTETDSWSKLVAAVGWYLMLFGLTARKGLFPCKWDPDIRFTSKDTVRAVKY